MFKYFRLWFAVENCKSRIFDHYMKKCSQVYNDFLKKKKRAAVTYYQYIFDLN